MSLCFPGGSADGDDEESDGQDCGEKVDDSAAEVVSILLQAHPPAAKCADASGCYPLHCKLNSLYRYCSSHHAYLLLLMVTVVVWVYYNRSGACNKPVRFTLLEGNSATLEEGCGGSLYPATTGWITATDMSPPNPKVNGQELPLTIEVMTENVRDQSAVVSFTLSVEDDCDSSPTVTASHSSGDSFPVGNTTVTVTATDVSRELQSPSIIFTLCPFVPKIIIFFILKKSRTKTR